MTMLNYQRVFPVLSKDRPLHDSFGRFVTLDELFLSATFNTVPWALGLGDVSGAWLIQGNCRVIWHAKITNDQGTEIRSWPEILWWIHRFLWWPCNWSDDLVSYAFGFLFVLLNMQIIPSIQQRPSLYQNRAPDQDWVAKTKGSLRMVLVRHWAWCVVDKLHKTVNSVFRSRILNHR